MLHFYEIGDKMLFLFSASAAGNFCNGAAMPLGGKRDSSFLPALTADIQGL